MNKQTLDTPALVDCAKELPDEIKDGTIIEFKKPIKVIGFPVIKGSALRRNAIFGEKTTITVERGIVLETNTNVIMFRIETEHREMVFPLQHTN